MLMVGLVGSAGAALLVVHLLSAVGAVQNAGQRIRLVADALSDALRFPQTLDNIPCFLVNDGGVGVLEPCVDNRDATQKQQHKITQF